MDFQLPQYDLVKMLPEIVLFLWALLVMTTDVLGKRKSPEFIGYMTMLGLIISGVLLATVGYGTGFGNMFINDTMAVFFKVIFLGAAFMAVGSAFGITREKIQHHRGEFYGLLLFSTVGMMFLASSSELLSLYIGLELTTIPLFVLAAFFKDDQKSAESGAKYLIIGAFSSAILLYGLSFLYGLTGSTDISVIRMALTEQHFASAEGVGLVMILAIVAIVAGIGFKLALPPFHQWAPDVYEGAPTPVTAFLSVGSKAAGLVAFAKIMVIGLFSFYEPIMSPSDWGILVAVLAGAAMIFGNSVAIRQTNIKRMLAYSSIAHAGYVMIGMLSINELGLSAVGFYMFAYMFTNMGAFAVVALVEDKTGSCEIADYDGLARSSPFLAGTMTVFLLSLTGIPPLAGFFGKYFVFAAAIKAAGSSVELTWMYVLVGVGLITSVFALYYYAGVMKVMYFGKAEAPPRIPFNAPALVVLAIGLLGVLVFGLYPEPIVTFASDIPRNYAFLLLP
ncbi:NADH-quinone oxidoreductase subunit NuoN [candidate division GN15 bacterium]|nr:NADH-quinone oxidoreductase subunit NuoN [candidate division GN15 bacterium]